MAVQCWRRRWRRETVAVSRRVQCFDSECDERDGRSLRGGALARWLGRIDIMRTFYTRNTRLHRSWSVIASRRSVLHDGGEVRWE